MSVVEGAIFTLLVGIPALFLIGLAFGLYEFKDGKFIYHRDGL